MRIDMYVATACVMIPYQRTGCGILMTAVDEHQRMQYREFGFGLGTSTEIRAIFAAALLGIQSVKSGFQKDIMGLYAPAGAIYVLEHPEELDDISDRALCDRYVARRAACPSIQLTNGSGVYFERAMQLASTVADAQTRHDSGTISPGNIHATSR